MSICVAVDGEAEGPVLATTTPLSLWGGIDAATGVVIDRQHPLCGRSVSGSVLVLPAGRGSSAASAVLLELLVAGHGPAALILREHDDILTVGVIVAEQMFDAGIPLLVADAATFASALTALHARIRRGGLLHLGAGAGPGAPTVTVLPPEALQRA